MNMIARRVSLVAMSCSLGWAVPASAQNARDLAAMQAQIVQMQQQMQAMQGQISVLQNQLANAQARADAASTAVAAVPAQIAAAQAANAPTVSAKPETKITWDGAPKLEAAVDPKNPKAGTWSFKPRGRVQIDVGSLSAPKALGSKETGFASEFRRAYLGVDGTIPGNFGYRVEADFAASSVNLTDLYLTWKPNARLTLTAGQQKPFWGLEEMTSDLFTSFQERAAFSTAFGFERRIGFSAAWLDKDVLVQGGVFTDDAATLNSDTDNSYSIDGRVVFMPKVGGGQLHLGGSAHFRKFKDLQATARYNARPFLHTTDLRLIDTKAFTADGERSFGLEGAYIIGPFHATAESHWLTATRSGLANPTFNGGYAEVGMLLTKGDSSAYKGGVYDRIRPKNGVDKGGLGAIQMNLRYDWLDLNDAGIVGGRQQIAGASLLWIPTDYVRFIVNYGHVWIDDAAVPAGAARNYTANALGMRAQFDF
ncbi:OprO/OprP family phosphate-selective porin [Novosphingobium lentum]|uniref:OprO/OprP family phosphate-selective porin n=1 Tax=Novosphingobium lentum TaxID=145287 RepID=UPI000831C3CF|nr:porin [Novosphingobium lentum]